MSSSGNSTGKMTRREGLILCSPISNLLEFYKLYRRNMILSDKGKAIHSKESTFNRILYYLIGLPSSFQTMHPAVFLVLYSHIYCTSLYRTPTEAISLTVCRRRRRRRR